jgi:ABC-type branched-subunit amino acid transport system substrate-binding protein
MFWMGACEGPDLGSLRFKCSDHDDCGSGYQCHKIEEVCIAALKNEDGVHDDRILIGMSGAFDKNLALADVAEAGKLGFLAYFDQVNRQGGIYGRRLELKVMDDKYDATITAANVEKMLGGESREVFAIGGVFGTEPALAARAAAIQKKVLFYAPGTGFDALEPDPPDRYVFNVRGRYNEESEQLTRYALNSLNVEPENVALFAQGDRDGGDVASLDPFGQSGWKGVKTALAGGVPDEKVLVTTYEIKTKVVAKSVATSLVWMASTDRKPSADQTVLVAITIAALADAATAFICGLEGELLKAKAGLPLSPGLNLTQAQIDNLKKVKVQFLSLSPVGVFLPQALAAHCSYTDPGTGLPAYFGVGTIVANPMPDPKSNATGVIKYQEQLKNFKPDAKPDPISLEGYISAWLLGEGLKKHGPDITTESLIDTLETLDVDLGIGSRLKFSSESHQATSKLWATRIKKDLTYEPLAVLGQD